MVNSRDQSTRTFGERISNALKAIHPYGCAKLVSRETGISQRTVERILDGSGAPSLENFARLLAAYPSLLLVLAPVVSWAPIATAAVEQEVMQTQMIEAEVKRQRATEAMRGRL